MERATSSTLLRDRDGVAPLTQRTTAAGKLAYGRNKRLTECLHMRWPARLLCVLLVAWASAAAAADRPASADAPDSPLQEIESAEKAFVRAAAVPAWADLQAPPPAPPQASRRPIVVRLVDTHLQPGSPPIRLTNRVVQVNDASALAEIGQLALEFNPQFERLLLHRVLILRGKQTIDHTRTAPVRFLQREARLEEGLYSGVITASIVLPGVRAGDTLQVVHSIVGENPTLSARYSQRVSWEQPYPILLRRVTLVVPTERRILWRWYGGAGGDGPAPTETVASGIRRLRFEARDLAAAGVEPMTPPDIEPMRSLQFSEYADWNEVARWALNLFPTDPPLPDEMAPVMAGLRALSDPEEQASQALQWVQNEIRHWSVAVGPCAMRPQLPAVVLQRGYGDCKDKALLLTRMLRELGIEARPALASLSTRSGPASMLPAPEVFDHVIVQARLAGRAYYLDPTRHGQAGMLSRMGQRLEEAAVLPVDADTQDLVIVRSPNRAEIFRSQLHERLSLARFGGEGQLEVEIRWFGLNAETLRMSLLRMDPAELRRFVAAGYLQQYAGSRLVGEPRLSDDRRLNQLTLNASFAVPRLARAAGEQWGVPFAPSLGDAIVLPQRLTRRFPLAVPSFPATFHYRVDMAWPDGTALGEEPESQRLETPHFRLLTTRSVLGSSESRTIEFTAKVNQVPPVEIPSLVEDLGRLARQVGGVMVAASSGSREPAPTPAVPGGRLDDSRPGTERR
jgi:transglutaminase-like putative cysteine protease